MKLKLALINSTKNYFSFNRYDTNETFQVNRVNVYNSPTKTTVAMISSSEDLVDIRVIEKDVAHNFDSKLFTVIKDPCKGYGFNVTADGDNQNSSVVSEVASDGRAIKQGLKKGHRIVEVG